MSDRRLRLLSKVHLLTFRSFPCLFINYIYSYVCTKVVPIDMSLDIYICTKVVPIDMSLDIHICSKVVPIDMSLDTYVYKGCPNRHGFRYIYVQSLSQ